MALHDAGDENLCLSQLVENQEREVGKRPGSKLSQSRGGSARFSAVLCEPPNLFPLFLGNGSEALEQRGRDVLEVSALECTK